MSVRESEQRRVLIAYRTWRGGRRPDWRRRSGRRPHGGSVLDMHIILTLHNPMTSSGCATCKESLPTHGDQRHLLLGATAATRSSACAPWQEKCMERSSSSSERDGLDQLAVEGGTRAHTTDQRMRRRAGLLGV